jgi:hypothetical protein
MTRVLVVNHDPHVAAEQAETLRGAGYDVELCGGPAAGPCPVLDELPCPLVDRADALVYDAWATGHGEGGRQLVDHLRDTYADLPVVLTGVTPGLDWVETVGPHRVMPLTGQPGAEQLVAAVILALADQGMAV